MSFNLLLRLTATIQPECKAIFCQQISEDASCVINTPGAENCVEVAGSFYIPSVYLAYSLLALSLAIAFYFSKRFYLSRILLVLLFFASIVVAIRIILGALKISSDGILQELNKLGLYQSFVKEIGGGLLEMVYPKI